MGVYEVSFTFTVHSSGYFNVGSTGDTADWGWINQFYFNGDGTGYDTKNGDEWMYEVDTPMAITISIDTTASGILSIDNVPVCTFAWDETLVDGASNGNFGGVNFYPHENGAEMTIDDFSNCPQPFDAIIACGSDWDFHMVDSWGDGWNGNVATVTDCEGNVLVNATIEDGNGEVADFCLEHDLSTGYWITVDGGNFQSEVSWSLLDENGVVQLEGGAPYSNYTNCAVLGCTDASALNYDSMANTDDGSCQYCEHSTDWEFHMVDSWGDGWDGNVATVTDCEGNVIVEATLEDGDAEVADFCLEHDLSTGYWITVDGGNFQGEVSWSLLDENGVVQLEGGAPYDGDQCPDCDDLDADGVCDDVDNCVGDYDECGICNGDGATCAPVVLVESTVSFPDTLTPAQQNELRDEYCAATAVATGIPDAAQYLTCTCEQITSRRRLLNVEYLLSASVSQSVLTAANINVELIQTSLQSEIVVDEIVAATSSIDEVSCDTDGTCGDDTSGDDTSGDDTSGDDSTDTAQVQST